MEELKNFNIHDLFRVINKQDDEFLQWLMDKKLIWTIQYCECGKETIKEKIKDGNGQWKNG